MTAVKIAGKPRAAATGSIEAAADWLYDHPGGRMIGVVEFVHTERTEPAPEEQKDRSVTLGISLLELATADQEEVLRKAARALFLIRTTSGTLDPDGDVEMSERILQETNRNLPLAEAVRLRVGLKIWADKARAAFQAPNITGPELAHELEAIAVGLLSLASGRPEEE